MFSRLKPLGLVACKAVPTTRGVERGFIHCTVLVPQLVVRALVPLKGKVTHGALSTIGIRVCLFAKSIPELVTNVPDVLLTRLEPDSVVVAGTTLLSNSFSKEDATKFLFSLCTLGSAAGTYPTTVLV
uniref:Uncharacterized protein n=1 Tax=Cacopsylla melanoneura TaxID=428564 RepID=A0A8D8UBK4_9HEMI